MTKPSAVLAEPLSLGQEKIPGGTRNSRKVLLICSLLIGLVLAMFFNPMSFARNAVEEPAIDMFGTPASPMSMSCSRGGPISVTAMQDTLKKYGIPSSPMVRYVLTSYAATRDVSMAAQAREEFSRMDPVTQAKFRKLSQEVVVKASTLKPEEMAGVTKPLGFWDPAGLSKKGNLAVYREAELKHGRVCMLAALGIIVTEEFHPFFDFWGDGPFVSAAASHFSATASANFWPAFWVMAAGHEIATSLNGGFNADPKARAPGDYGFDPLSLKPTDPGELKTLQNKEINNGRLAMVASMGILAQELITGKKIF